MVFILRLMAINTKDSGSMEKNMAKVNMFTLAAVHMRDNGIKIRCMAKANLLLKVESTRDKCLKD